MDKKIVEVKNLRKGYNEVTAVDNLSFEIYENEIFGMVGPNGAGKTTTIECVEGLRNKDSGEIKILGLNNPETDGDLKTKIGIQLQESSLPERIKVREAMEMFSSLYPRTIDWKDLLAKLNLTE
ncbi:MAG: ATP-binding cassette domain-containing protein, partial [Caldiserica bacterium]|nr:ATP-binding cassette domain-containing protein [Caldisericota bacterium]